jgi:hypothetical protein
MWDRVVIVVAFLCLALISVQTIIMGKILGDITALIAACCKNIIQP